MLQGIVDLEPEWLKQLKIASTRADAMKTLLIQLNNLEKLSHPTQ